MEPARLHYNLSTTVIKAACEWECTGLWVVHRMILEPVKFPLRRAHRVATKYSLDWINVQWLCQWLSNWHHYAFQVRIESLLNGNLCGDILIFCRFLFADRIAATTNLYHASLLGRVFLCFQLAASTWWLRNLVGLIYITGWDINLSYGVSAIFKRTYSCTR